MADETTASLLAQVAALEQEQREHKKIIRRLNGEIDKAHYRCRATSQERAESGIFVAWTLDLMRDVVEVLVRAGQKKGIVVEIPLTKLAERDSILAVFPITSIQGVGDGNV